MPTICYRRGSYQKHPDYSNATKVSGLLQELPATFAAPDASKLLSPSDPTIMPKAVLLTIDDDPEVLKAIERDLRNQYAKTYRVLSANSGQSALDLLDKLRQRGEAVALFLADYRMPQMTGIEFLSRAIKFVPRCQASPAHRLCGYRSGHTRDQRNQAESLFVEAVGSAGAEPLSRC